MINQINQALSLQEVNAKFEEFRSERKKLTKFPDHLWEQAVKLLEHYSLTEVCQQLRVSTKQIKAQMDKLNAKPSPDINFVEVNNDLSSANNSLHIGIQANNSDERTKVEITRPDGAQLVINQLPESALTKLLTQFMEGFV